ncbi:hypothetical protein Trydic_g22812 [Trypoxylus dichotomus]
MATNEEGESDPQTIANLFQEGLDLFNHLDTLTEPTNSPNFQTSIKKAMRILEDVTRSVSSVGMFSRNESVEEIATSDIQYLLLPALLGSLSLKLTSGDRNTIINVAEVYFKDFLQRCNDYGLTIDEIKSIEMEKPILEHMAKLGKDDKPKSKRPPPPPLKPIIITKDEVQKAVFGAGYPSLPTMTVQEFYEKRVRDGIFPDPNKPQVQKSLTLQEASLAGISLNDEEEKENEQKENLIEEDDPEYIERMRASDEFKDDHRRGWGNRMNRS